MPLSPIGPYVLVRSGKELDCFIQIDAQGKVDAVQSYLSGRAVSGSWDEELQQLRFDVSLEERDSDEYVGYAITRPAIAVIGATDVSYAGIFRSYSGHPQPDFQSGWYAARSPLQAERWGPQDATDSDLSGIWEVNVGDRWKLLDLHIDDVGSVESSRLGDEPVGGAFDAQSGALTLITGDAGRGSEEYLGYIVKDDASGVVALAGEVNLAERDPQPRGWFARRRWPAPLLSSSNKQMPSTPKSPYWASDFVSAQVFPFGDRAVVEWVPVLNGAFQGLSDPDPLTAALAPQSHLDAPTIVSLRNESDSARCAFENEPSGYIDVFELSSSLTGYAFGSHLSTGDLPFTHPFKDISGDGPHEDQLDWNFYVVPDHEFEYLMSITNADLRRDTPWLTYSDDIDAAIAEARVTLPPDSPVRPIHGAIGVETDALLLPKLYRPHAGDRVFVVGRWIIDAGHPNFGAEIHPPLFVASARPPLTRALSTSGGQAAVTAAQDLDRTEVYLVGRPYLVGQTYSYDGDAPRGVASEIHWQLFGLGLSYALDSSAAADVASHPDGDPLLHLDTPILPGWGAPEINFIVRPPTGRLREEDRLFCSWDLTARSGIDVAMLADAVRDELLVTISTTSAFRPAGAPDPTDSFPVSPSKFSTTGQDIEKLVDQVIADSPFGWDDPVVDALQAVVHRGASMSRFPGPVANTPDDGSQARSEQPVEGRWTAQTVVSDAQPYPIYGRIGVYWKRG